MVGGKRRSSSRQAPAKPLPFSLNLLEKRSLTSQLVAGIRESISTGYYLPGDLLPSFSEMSVQLGVSLIVARHAVSELTAEGLVLARHGYGIIVLDRLARVWKGTVLFVTTEHKSIYFTHFIKNALRRRLVTAGYLFESLVVERDNNGEYDFTQLGVELTKFVKLVVLYHAAGPVMRFICERGVPYVGGMGASEFGQCCCGTMQLRFDAAIEAFLKHSKAVGVRNVWQVGLGPESDPADIVQSFETAGISVVRKITPPYPGYHRPECFERSAMSEFQEICLHRKDELPDLLYFTDDYIATGALTALLASGVSIPGGVKVVSFSNCGLGPVFPLELTRIEVDARQAGEVYAEAVLSFLCGQEDGVRGVVSARYVIGETFPAVVR